jgi:hypothetical protein
MTINTYLQSLDLPAQPLDFSWAPLDADLIWAATDEDDPRLAQALSKIQVTPLYALGVACCEWVAARFESHADVADLRLRIEAAWAGVVDWRYARITDVTPLSEDVPRQTVRPVWFCAHLMSRAFVDFASDESLTNTHAFARLCNHVLGRHPAFEPWLTSTMRRLEARFPATGGETGGRPVPRSFFDPAFVWDDARVEDELKHYIGSLEVPLNPYLREPHLMLDKGFVGTPYRYPA